MPTLKFFNFLKGGNWGLSPILLPSDALAIQNGVVTSWKLGSVLKDTGYFRVGAQIENNKSILGLHDFRQDASTQKILATVNDASDDDTQLFYKTAAGAWTEIGAAETAWANFANINVEMETFIGYCFFVGHGTTDGFLPVGSLTGTTFSTSDQVTSMAQGKFIKRYRDRLYVLNCRSGGTNYPFRIYFSSVPSAGSITWTPATDFIDVDYGLEIKGGEAMWDRLVVFTEENTYFYDQSSFKKIWDVGCSNHRTIQKYSSYLIWCTGQNIALSTGGQPQFIGGEVIDFIRNGNPLNFFADLVNEEYNLYVGTVTVNGIIYTNCMLTYNFPTDSWRVRELADNMTIFAKYYDRTTGKMRHYMGDEDGQVWDKSQYIDATIASSDSETTLGTKVNDIHAHFEFVVQLGEYSINTKIDNLIAYAERAGALKLKARALDRNSRALSEYMDIGELRDYVNTFRVECGNAALLQVEGTEYGKNPYFSFYGVEVEIKPHSRILKDQNA